MSTKPDVRVGSCGWRHAHWQGSYYPDELPEDWRLGYYSNDFNAVLVNTDELLATQALPVEDWLDEVHEGFRFYVEYSVSSPPAAAGERLRACLAALKPQLGGVLVRDASCLPARERRQLDSLLQSLAIPLYCPEEAASGGQSSLSVLWQAGRAGSAGVALLRDELNDLRRVRTLLEGFLDALGTTAAADKGASAVLVSHDSLRAEKLSRLRVMLEIMGY